MRNKVIAAYASFTITFLTLAVIIVLYFVNDFETKELLLNIFYSLFGGAFVTFVLSLFEYNNLKRDTIDDFYDEYLNYLIVIEKIRYTNIGEKEKIVADYVSYKDVYNVSKRNEIVARLDTLLAKEGLEIDHKDIDKYFESEGAHLKKSIDKTIVTYLDAIHHDLNKLWKIISSMYFFNPLSNKFHKQANEMFNDAEDLLNKLTEKEKRFEMFLDGDLKNLSEIVKDIDDLNNKVFKIEQNENGSKAWFEKTYNSGLERLLTFVEKTLKIKSKEE